MQVWVSTPPASAGQLQQGEGGGGTNPAHGGSCTSRLSKCRTIHFHPLSHRVWGFCGNDLRRSAHLVHLVGDYSEKPWNNGSSFHWDIIENSKQKKGIQHGILVGTWQGKPRPKTTMAPAPGVTMSREVAQDRPPCLSAHLPTSLFVRELLQPTHVHESAPRNVRYIPARLKCQWTSTS